MSSDQAMRIQTEFRRRFARELGLLPPTDAMKNTTNEATEHASGIPTSPRRYPPGRPLKPSVAIKERSKGEMTKIERAEKVLDGTITKKPASRRAKKPPVNAIDFEYVQGIFERQAAEPATPYGLPKAYHVKFTDGKKYGVRKTIQKT